MELLFLFIAIIFTKLIIYGVGRTAYTHHGLLNTYRDTEFLFLSHLFLGLMLTSLFFVILAAFNLIQ